MKLFVFHFRLCKMERKMLGFKGGAHRKKQKMGWKYDKNIPIDFI
ncbi:hypothetical protein B4110_0209 [Parageobacillus toebii]|uniref:Uncharacterized protein n=1 Tax=Parageobacillus toebii TaxID=153151 RepID=A0A150MC97_9BACL|nr:hypothetical protein B4110_0209 [Parageobacillus toebii]